MKELISDTLEWVENDLKKEIENECLCLLKTLRYNNYNAPDYNQNKLQLLYLLRYYPAYLCEYKYLYKKILEYKAISELSVLSIGCGYGIDYHGAYLALNKDISRISYLGIDLVDWNKIDSLDNPKFSIVQQNIKDFSFSETNNFNVLMFPKSISEFDNDSFNVFVDNLSKSEFTQEHIYVVSSVMNEGFNYDEDKYKLIIATLETKGFVNEKYNKTMCMKNKGGLVLLDSDFNYPNEIIDFIKTLSTRCKTYIETQKNCEPNCSSLNRSPILTSRYMSFQINHLQRK